MLKLVLVAAFTIPFYARAASIDELRDLARRDSADQLCVFQLSHPHLAYIAVAELKARNVLCDWGRAKQQYEDMQRQAVSPAQAQRNEELRQQTMRQFEQIRATNETERIMREDIQRMQAARQAEEEQERQRKDAANNQLLQFGLQMLQNSRPQAPTYRPPTSASCQTFYFAGGARTTCN